MDKASEQAIRAGQIIRRLRDFVARGELEKRPENLEKLIEDAVALGLVAHRERSITVTRDLASDAFVLADRVQIQQVLVNLVRNAAEAMAESERRELTFHARDVSDGMVEISVSDTGKGLPEGVREHLFRPFFTTKETGMESGFPSAEASSRRTEGICSPSRTPPAAQPSGSRCHPLRRKSLRNSPR